MELDDSRILITGAGGYIGGHLLTLLRNISNAELFGIGRKPDIKPRLDGFLSVDLCDAAAAQRAVSFIQPNLVFHLAGGRGKAAPGEAWRTNVEGSRHLLTALRRYAERHQDRVRMVVSGSAAEVGSQAAAFSPVSESVACAPESEYGKSKLEVTRLCQQESSPPMEIVVARTFNVCGPGLHRDLVLGNIAAQIHEIQQGRRDRIECGFLGSRRDFVDVRDVARAYVALAQRGSPGEIYNVCSGESQLLRELVTRMLAEAGLDVTICERNEARPGDPLDIYGNRAKIESETGWSPQIPLPQSLREMLGTEVSA